MIKSVYFAAKSIDFAAEKGYSKARQGGETQYKFLNLMELGEKTVKKAKNG